ncbi:MAG: enoyl-CoA hydratase-related protein [Rhizobiaceae bacterium]|nr:enoyl-CoA hydratase-related protein [Rhizobiaceae bacterium]
MSDYKTIQFSTDARGVATITLARPQKHNAMNADMILELAGVAGEISDNSSIHVCILEAEGRTFCAGGDLGWMQTQMTQSREEKIAGAMGLAQMLNALDELPCPLIGKVQGSAFGGGIGMMAVCDVVIAAQGAKFALTETKLGLIPATIGPFVIRRIGEAFARQYFFSAKPFDCETALRMNLVSQVSSAEELDILVEKEIATILNCRPGAVRDAKALAKELARNPSMESQKLTASKLADRWETNEAQEAISAFFATKK